MGFPLRAHNTPEREIVKYKILCWTRHSVRCLICRNSDIEFCLLTVRIERDCQLA